MKIIPNTFAQACILPNSRYSSRLLLRHRTKNSFPRAIARVFVPGSLHQFDLGQGGGGGFDRLIRANLGDSHRTKVAQGNEERWQVD